MSTALAWSLSGREKAAMLLLALGPELSKQVLSHLSAREADAVCGQLARLPGLDREAHHRLTVEFADYLGSLGQRSSAAGADTFACSRLAAGQGRAQAEPGRAHSVREFDTGRLEKVPREALVEPSALTQSDIRNLGALPVECQAELAMLNVSLAGLAQLEVGDVLLLGPAQQVQTELVGGDRCRLGARICEQDGYRAVELVGQPRASGVR